MKTPNKQLMKQARESLAGHWAISVGAFFIYQALLIGVRSIPKAGFLLYILSIGPLSLGLAMFILSISRGQDTKFEKMFEGFKRYSTSLIASLLMALFIILWSLLLIIPGIIAGLSYSMTYYIIADDAAMSASEAIKKSKKMMYGYKWKLFCLHFRFVGWMILCVLTLGIGFLWLIPYIQMAQAKFYEDIKSSDTPVIA